MVKNGILPLSGYSQGLALLSLSAPGKRYMRLMNNWNIVPEFIACLIVFIITINSYIDNDKDTVISKSFFLCIVFSIIGVLTSTISSIFLVHPYLVPLKLNILSQELKSITMLIAGMLIYRHIVVLAYELLNLQKEMNIAINALYFIIVIYTIVIFANGYTHWFFHFDENRQFITGPLHQSEFLILAIYAIIIFINIFSINHKLENPIKRAFLTGILAAGSVIILQKAYPNTIFSGLSIANSLLIVLICAQQTQINVDSLTGFHNRAALLQTVNLRVKKNQPFMIAVISLKNFKRINMRLGYINGDIVLRKIGEFLSTLPGHPTPYRIFGTDYAILLPLTGSAESATLIKEIRDRFELPWKIKNNQCLISISTALLICKDCRQDGPNIILNLDYSLHALKKSSQPQHITFTDDCIAKFEQREHIIELLKTAVTNNLFTVVYQPIYSIKTGTYVGGEALVRLNDTNGQSISPYEFIQIAEETGFISDIGYIVIEKVCRFLSEHPDYKDRFITINISAQQFIKREFFVFLQTIFQQYHIDPKQIKLEITERALLTEDNDNTNIINVLKEFSRLGVGIYLDDFGTGYSNLYIINHFSFDCIKFDRSLIENIDKNPTAFDILCSFADGINKTETEVLIEGVETAEEYHALKRVGFNMLQGYLLTRPVSEEQFREKMILKYDDFIHSTRLILQEKPVVSTDRN